MKKSRTKGASGEREAADLIRSITGTKLRRTPLSGGMEFKGDVQTLEDGIVRDHHIEIKRVEALNLPKAWRQACDDCPPSKTAIVMHRRNNTEWMVTVRAADYWGYLAELEELRSLKVAA